MIELYKPIQIGIQRQKAVDVSRSVLCKLANSCKLCVAQRTHSRSVADTWPSTLSQVCLVKLMWSAPMLKTYRTIDFEDLFTVTASRCLVGVICRKTVANTEYEGRKLEGLFRSVSPRYTHILILRTAVFLKSTSNKCGMHVMVPLKLGSSTSIKSWDCSKWV